MQETKFLPREKLVLVRDETNIGNLSNEDVIEHHGIIYPIDEESCFLFDKESTTN